MAAFETSRTVPFGAITTFRIVRIVGNAFTAVAVWNDARVTRNALAKLSDRELDDIGLCRDDISRMGSLERL